MRLKLPSTQKLHVLALIVGLMLVACTPEKEEAIPGESQIALTDCRLESFGGYTKIKALCGSLPVLLDPENPDRGTIDLAIAKIPALNRKPAASAFTFIAGGPGQSSLQGYVSQSAVFDRILREHDVILLDQRGTGSSSRQQCESYQDAEFKDATVWSAEMSRKAALMCAHELGEDVAFYTTSTAVQDLEQLRQAMGYQQLDVYGVSYGTRVAQHYLRRYPQFTRTVILDGVVPVNLSLGPTIATDAQHALQMVFDRCANEVGCKNEFGDIAEKFSALRKKLDNAVVEVAMPDPLSGEPGTHRFGPNELGAAIRLMSYSPEMVSLMPLMIHQASMGNFRPLTAQAIQNIDLLEDMLAYGMHNTVVCAEDVPFFDKSAIDTEALTQTYMGDVAYQGLVETCKVWPSGPIDDDFKQPFESAIPVLLLSGESDPVTPPANAEIAAAYLGNTLSLVVAGQGHNVGPIGCLPKLMSQFVIAGNFQELETSCVDIQQARPFFQNFSGSEP